ncbi:MAG: 50S ribosomal protein L13 [Patescibacteria group bacterium]
MQRTVVKLDATGQTAGRLATQIAMMLMGKHRPTYVPNIDTGDVVEVTHVEKMEYKGRNKGTNKKYYKHTGYVGNMKITTLDTMMRVRPDFVLRAAVSRMLPKNRMRQDRLLRLIIK